MVLPDDFDELKYQENYFNKHDAEWEQRADDQLFRWSRRQKYDLKKYDGPMAILCDTVKSNVDYLAKDQTHIFDTG